MTDEEKEQQIKERKKRMPNHKVGEYDLNGNLITKVYAKDPEYAIYEIESKDIADSIKVHIEDDYPEILKRYNSIRIKYIEIKGILYKVVDKATTKATIAQIIVLALTKNTQEAEQEFNKLKKGIEEDYKEQFANRHHFKQ